ncbi:hypothetical protein JTB14_028081 [Gonioctena quinquepunctata]|nr:hypothetical protein JTB14_028081 [Gonioctena quinquepunctata]
MAYIIPSVLALLFVINTAYGLTCYTCESNGNHQCSWNTEVCDETLMRSECFIIDVPTPDGNKYTKRGCLPTGSCDTVTHGVKALLGNLAPNIEITCHTCTGDKCNSASSLTGFTILGFILSAVVFVL